MLHVMVHELGVYDRHFLKHETNGPYLVKADGHYLRDAATNKPLIWDLDQGNTRPFDEVGRRAPGDPAIEGTYMVAGEAVRPGDWMPATCTRAGAFLEGSM
jgi:hypothetical protein